METFEGSATVTETNESPKEKKPVKIRFSVFFDGTCNNRTNTQSRLDNSDVYKNHKGVGSYENDFTNVAKMEPYVVVTAPPSGFTDMMCTYIEGPGTMNEEKDRKAGYALGWFKSGVRAKVKKGLYDVVEKIAKKYDKENEVFFEQITLDVFGFSRGAAGARNFIHEALFGTRAIQKQLEEQLYEVKKVEVWFAGLYDTVSSHGVIYSNDTEDLKLDAVTHAKTVIHLAAADEHRENFSLWTIESAGGKGKEIYLPGVHSDVGGSYNDGASESQIINRLDDKNKAEEDRDRLVAAGWFDKNEIELKDLYDTYQFNTEVAVAPQYELHVHRKAISNLYSRIPLNIMAKYVRQNDIVLEGKFDDREKVPNELNEAKQAIDSKLESADVKSADFWLDNTKDWMLKLRNKYFHFSAKMEFGLTPRFVDGKRGRKRYAG